MTMTLDGVVPAHRQPPFPRDALPRDGALASPGNAADQRRQCADERRQSMRTRVLHAQLERLWQRAGGTGPAAEDAAVRALRLTSLL